MAADPKYGRRDFLKDSVVSVAKASRDVMESVEESRSILAAFKVRALPPVPAIAV